MNNSSLQNSPLEHGDIEARLWEYIDGLSTETSAIEILVRENSEWKAKYTELLEVHQLMGKTELEHPSLRFTKNVMDEIARFQIAPATKKYINTKIIWGLAAFFIAIIVGFLGYGVSQIDWSAADSSSSALGVDLGAVDYSRMFDNSIVNGFMMVNILLGLLLLDRFLNMKRKAYREEGYRA
ncbi:MAG: hypothetical protein JWR72_4068 [Flavisolibacter sp.]|jgi:hypothetical protein|nr:hypothetical protein [Flavisolibacter sp.]